MAKREFTLTEVEQQELRQAYAACGDGVERTRLQAVRLYGTGWAVPTIIEITGCTRRSLVSGLSASGTGQANGSA